MRTVAIVIGLLACAQVARAQDFAEAGRHFTAAKTAFDEQHFKVAATEFEAAFKVAKDPVLLYNIGESWEKGGEGKKAADAYKAYVKAQPKAQDRADVEKRIKHLTAKHYKVASQSAPGDVVMPVMAEAAPPPVTPPPPVEPPPMVTEKPTTLTPDFLKEPPPTAAVETPAPAVVEIPGRPVPDFLDAGKPSKMRVAAWIGVATTVAVLTAGAIFGLAAQSRADEISRRESFIDSNGQPHAFDATAQADYNNLKSEGQLYNGLAIGFFCAAGVTAIVTTVLFVLDSRRAHPRRDAFNLSPTVGKDTAGLSLKWSF